MQPGGGRRGERGVADVGESRAAPQRERVAQAVARPRAGIAAARSAAHRRAASRSKRLASTSSGSTASRYPRRRLHDGLGAAEGPAQPRDERLQRVGLVRRRLSPQTASTSAATLTGRPASSASRVSRRRSRVPATSTARPAASRTSSGPRIADLHASTLARGVAEMPRTRQMAACAARRSASAPAAAGCTISPTRAREFVGAAAGRAAERLRAARDGRARDHRDRRGQRRRPAQRARRAAAARRPLAAPARQRPATAAITSCRRSSRRRRPSRCWAGGCTRHVAVDLPGRHQRRQRRPDASGSRSLPGDRPGSDPVLGAGLGDLDRSVERRAASSAATCASSTAGRG